MLRKNKDILRVATAESQAVKRSTVSASSKACYAQNYASVMGARIVEKARITIMGLKTAVKSRLKSSSHASIKRFLLSLNLKFLQLNAKFKQPLQAQK